MQHTPDVSQPTKRPHFKQRYRVLRQDWIEVPISSNGRSYHLNEKDRKDFIDQYWEALPDAVSDQYARPNGEPRWVIVGHKLYRKVINSTNGVKIHGEKKREKHEH